MKPDLEKTFFKYLIDQRIKNIEDQASNKTFPFQLNSKNVESLHNKLSKLRAPSLEMENIEFKNSFVRDSKIRSILRSYAACISDISLNEVTVHSMNHTDANLDNIYLKFELKLIKQTTNLYSYIHPAVLGSEFIERFISQDSELINRMFLSRTIYLYFTRLLCIQLAFLHDGTDPSSAGSDDQRRIKNKREVNVKFDIIFSTSKNMSVQSPASNPKQLRDTLMKDIMQYNISSDEEEVNIKKTSSMITNLREGKKKSKLMDPDMKRSTSITDGEHTNERHDEKDSLINNIVGKVLSRSISWMLSKIDSITEIEQ